MKKLRYSTGFKTIIAIVQQGFFVVLVLSIIVISILFQKNILDFGDIKNQSFESSQYFSVRFEESVNEILNFTNLRKKFETNGNYDKEKIVSIWKYANSNQIGNGFSEKKDDEKREKNYYLGDLVEWSRDYSMSYFEFSSSYYIDNGIHQTQEITKNDSQVLNEDKMISGIYDMTIELQEQIVEKAEHVYGGSYSTNSKQQNEADVSTQTDALTEDTQDLPQAQTEVNQEQLEQIISRVIAGDLYSLNSEELQLLLMDMGMDTGNSITGFDFINEDYLPMEGTNIWSDFMQGNISVDRLKKEYADLEYTLATIGNEVNQYKRSLNKYNLGKDGTNVNYWIKKGNEDTVYTNMEEKNAKNLVEFGKKEGRYFYYREEDIRFETNVKGMEDSFYNKLEPEYGGKDNILFISVNTKLPYEDSFFQAKQEYTTMKPWIYISISSAVISALGCLICIIFLSLTAGKKAEDDQQVSLCWFDKIQTEIVFFGAVFVGIIFVFVSIQLFYLCDTSELAGLLIISGMTAFFGMAIFMIFYLSFVRRMRAGVLWSGSITAWIFNGIGMVFGRRRPAAKMLIWFAVHLLGCMLVLPFFASAYYDLYMIGISLFIALSAIEGVMIIREGTQRNIVLEGIRRISEGDLEFKIETADLKGENKQLAEAVNAVGDGLFHAVDASMKNERMKADLITNVSHDIKTPLTSIINYVDLLRREDIQNNRVQSYIAVLDQKSQRLKQLTEDLVEASKISSGNVTLQMERIDFVELVYQTGGEFDEKFEAQGLTAITKLPREPVVIMADGRRIWRVIENLYNNVAKYAMPHTRVYIDMKADEEYAHFSLKNISESALNINADELTERFIRGDVSRSTEGSGLGLSIAKNLTTLMGGDFEIYLDGDLFKVTVSFHRVTENRELDSAAEMPQLMDSKKMD